MVSLIYMVVFDSPSARWACKPSCIFAMESMVYPYFVCGKRSCRDIDRGSENEKPQSRGPTSCDKQSSFSVF